MIVHQVEIQRQGGVCVKYPTSCIVRQLIRKLLEPLRPIRVLDLSFGEGRFYAALENKACVTGLDIQMLPWIVKPCRFYRANAMEWRARVPNNARFDLVVADPPWSPYRRGWEKRFHYQANGGIPAVMYAAEKAAKHYNAHLLIHFMGKYIPYGYELVDELWYQGWSRLTKMPKPTWFGLLKPRGDKK